MKDPVKDHLTTIGSADDKRRFSRRQGDAYGGPPKPRKRPRLAVTVANGLDLAPATIAVEGAWAIEPEPEPATAPPAVTAEDGSPLEIDFTQPWVHAGEPGEPEAVRVAGLEEAMAWREAGSREASPSRWDAAWPEPDHARGDTRPPSAAPPATRATDRHDEATPVPEPADAIEAIARAEAEAERAQAAQQEAAEARAEAERLKGEAKAARLHAQQARRAKAEAEAARKEAERLKAEAEAARTEAARAKAASEEAEAARREAARLKTEAEAARAEAATAKAAAEEAARAKDEARRLREAARTARTHAEQAQDALREAAAAKEEAERLKAEAEAARAQAAEAKAAAAEIVRAAKAEAAKARQLAKAEVTAAAQEARVEAKRVTAAAEEERAAAAQAKAEADAVKAAADEALARAEEVVRMAAQAGTVDPAAARRARRVRSRPRYGSLSAGPSASADASAFEPIAATGAVGADEEWPSIGDEDGEGPETALAEPVGVAATETIDGPWNDPKKRPTYSSSKSPNVTVRPSGSFRPYQAAFTPPAEPDSE